MRPSRASSRNGRRWRKTTGPIEHSQQGHRPHAHPPAEQLVDVHPTPPRSSLRSTTISARRCCARPSRRPREPRLGVARVLSATQSRAASRKASWLSRPASAWWRTESTRGHALRPGRSTGTGPRLGDRDTPAVVGDPHHVGTPRARLREHLEGELLVRRRTHAREEDLGGDDHHDDDPPPDDPRPGVHVRRAG